MAMERWRPRGLRGFNPSEEMARILDEPFFADWPHLRLMWRRAPAEEMAWAPAVEMYDENSGFVVKAELPGVKKDNIDISVSGDTLTIKGEKKASKEVKEEDYYRCESQYGTFSRSITMPAAVDAKKIEATYQDGILEVHVPKIKEAVPTKVEIKVK